MKLTPIEEIYYEYMTTKEYMAHSKAAAIDGAERDIETLLSEVISNTFRDELSDAFTETSAAYEANGFVLGFEYALKILTQCGIGVKAE